MSVAGQGAIRAAPSRPAMGTFERFLTVWVLLCVVAGIGLGSFPPQAFVGEASVR